VPHVYFELTVTSSTIHYPGFCNFQNHPGSNLFCTTFHGMENQGGKIQDFLGGMGILSFEYRPTWRQIRHL